MLNCKRKMSRLALILNIFIGFYILNINGQPGCGQIQDADIVFVLDESGSVGTSGWTAMKNWLKIVVANHLPANSRVGFVRFSTGIDNTAKTLRTWTTQELVSEINGMTYKDWYNGIDPNGGWTHTQFAMQKGLEQFDDNNGRQKVLVLCTDGVPNFRMLII